MIQSDITKTLEVLKSSINKSCPKVLKEFRERMKKIQTNKNNEIQPEMTIPLKEFPFTEEITKSLKDLTLFNIELHDLLFSNDQSEAMTLRDYLNQFIDRQVVKLWPHEWMKTETLFRKVKSFIKQKTPKKLQDMAKPLSELSKAPQIFPNKTFTISSDQIKAALSAAKQSNSQTVQKSVNDEENDWSKAGTSKSGEPAAKRAKLDESLNQSKQIAEKNEDDNDLENLITETFSGDIDGSSKSIANKEEQSGSDSEKSRYNLRSKTDKTATISPIPNTDEHLIKEIEG